MSFALLHQHRFHVLSLVVLPCLVYLPVFTNGFVGLDDALLITENAAVQELSARSIAHVFSSYDPELYIPLTLLSYQLEYALAGPDPSLFHTTNLLLHILAALLVYAVSRRLLQSDFGGFVAALFFAVHPLNVETVAWASARKDGLSALLFFAALWLWLRWRETEAPHHYWGSLGTFLAALLAKVTAVMLPPVLALHAWYKEGLDRSTWRSLLPFFGIAVIFGIVAVIGKSAYATSLSLWDRVLLFAKGTIFLFWKLVLPTDLSVIYRQADPVTLTSAKFAVPVLLLVGLIALAVLLRRHWRLGSFGIGFFLLTLLPTLATFAKLHDVFFASDRYAYIPAVGLFLLLGAAAVWALQRAPVVVATFLAVWLGTLGVLSFRQTQVWQSSITLYEHALAVEPRNGSILNNLGAAYLDNNRREEATAAFKEAMAVSPERPEAYVNLGKIRFQDGQTEAAEVLLRQAVERALARPALAPEDATPFYALGELLQETNRSREAVDQFIAAANHAPDLAEAQLNAGIQLQATRQRDEAAVYLRRAVELEPDYLPALYRLAGVEAELGNLDEAEALLERVVEIEPTYEQAARHLENVRRMRL